jgi:hypothetical protein
VRATTIAAAGLLVGLALLASSCGSASSGATPAAATTTTTTGTPSDSPATGGNSAAFAKFAACMKKNGASVGRFRGRPPVGQNPPAGQNPPSGQQPPTGQRRTLTPARQKTFQKALAACRSLAPQGQGFGLRPSGQNNPQFAKYRACMQKHGVTLMQPGSTQQPNGDSKAFRAATQACGQLLVLPASGNGK